MCALKTAASKFSNTFRNDSLPIQFSRMNFFSRLCPFCPFLLSSSYSVLSIHFSWAFASFFSTLIYLISLVDFFLVWVVALHTHLEFEYEINLNITTNAYERILEHRRNKNTHTTHTICGEQEEQNINKETTEKSRREKNDTNLLMRLQTLFSLNLNTTIVHQTNI